MTTILKNFFLFPDFSYSVMLNSIGSIPCADKMLQLIFIKLRLLKSEKKVGDSRLAKVEGEGSYEKN